MFSEHPRQNRGKNRYKGKNVSLTNAVWYPDSRAFDHVTNLGENIHTIDPSSSRRSVVTANGNHIPVSKIGHSNFSLSSTSICLKDVLHVLEVKKKCYLCLRYVQIMIFVSNLPKIVPS